MVYGLLVGVVLRDAQALGDALKGLVYEAQTQIHIGQTENTVIHVIDLLGILCSFLEKIAERLIEVLMETIGAIQWPTPLRLIERPQIKGLKVMIKLPQPLQLPPRDLIIPHPRIILQPKLNLLQPPTHRKIINLLLQCHPLLILRKLIKDPHQLMKIQLLEVHPQPPHEEFDDVAALLGFVVAQHTKVLEGGGEETVEVVEVVDGFDGGVVEGQEFGLVGYRQELGLELLV